MHSKKYMFQQSFKRNCTISTGIPNLGVWCKKMIQLDIGVGVGQKNPTPTPPKNLKLHTTPQPKIKVALLPTIWPLQNGDSLQVNRLTKICAFKFCLRNDLKLPYTSFFQ